MCGVKMMDYINKIQTVIIFLFVRSNALRTIFSKLIKCTNLYQDQKKTGSI